MAAYGHSDVCCSTPIAQAEYNEKGSFIELDDGMRVYTTGPSDSKTAIFILPDIFGLRPQTLQGADILANGDKDKPRRVFLLDFFYGKPFNLDHHPPKNPEQEKELKDFFAGPANYPQTAAKLPSLLRQLEQKCNFKPEGWGVVGFCWGAKVVSLTSGPNTPWKVAAECHPAAPDPEDGKKFTIPVIMLASSGEDASKVDGFDKAVTTPHYTEIFKDQVHGWMAARGDFKDPHKKAEYERGYQLVLDFFHKHL